MISAQCNFEHRLHPKLGRLEDIFKEMLGRSFDDETLVRLMRMEAETMFPGLSVHDQGQIVDIVLEHMQIAEQRTTTACEARPSNVIQFPVVRKPWGER